MSVPETATPVVSTDVHAGQDDFFLTPEDEAHEAAHREAANQAFVDEAAKNSERTTVGHDPRLTAVFSIKAGEMATYQRVAETYRGATARFFDIEDDGSLAAGLAERERVQGENARHMTPDEFRKMDAAGLLGSVGLIAITAGKSDIPHYTKKVREELEKLKNTPANLRTDAGSGELPFKYVEKESDMAAGRQTEGEASFKTIPQGTEELPVVDDDIASEEPDTAPEWLQAARSNAQKRAQRKR